MKRKGDSSQAARELVAKQMAAAVNTQPFLSEASRRFGGGKENKTANARTAQELPAPKAASRRQSTKQLELADSLGALPPTDGLRTAGMLGQAERLMDPADAESPPAHSRLVVTSKDQKDFFAQNIKTLLGTQNEYYPYIGGKCLCGQCICGNCRCVHFRESCAKPLPLPTYLADYVAHKPQRTAQRVPQAENVQCAFPFSAASTYNDDYAPHNSRGQGPALLNRAKLDTLGPAALGLRAPIAAATSYQLHFPDWGNCKAKSLAPNLTKSITSGLPFIGKSENREYGQFFVDGQRPPPTKSCKTLQRSALDALGSKHPHDFTTTHRKDFTPSNAALREPLERKLPTDNIALPQAPFDGQYVPTSSDFGPLRHRLRCPMQEEILRLRRLLLAYARSEQIPV